MEEFGGEAILQNSTADSKTCFGSEMEFINSQLIRREDNGDHDHGHAYHDHVHHQDHVMGLFSSSGGGSSSGLMIPATVNFTDQMSLFQSSADHHHVHSLGFDGSKKDKSSVPHFFNFASPSASDTGLAIGDHNINFKTNLGGKKRKRNNAKNAGEKPKEVVHVRAKRGQATDSHSLAERVRREKINERLRCLQDLVPGCYKTMGMAVMLDVIINYVRSLQNQIEFLSMKLSAASMYNEMNIFEMAVDTMQSADDQGTEAYEAWTKWRE